uniref:non-specific serine/threonine protein kinase n=1 Tax=Hucho hucho TaxID=62062 RepID=A0A4W5QDN1_9TELE
MTSPSPIMTSPFDQAYLCNWNILLGKGNCVSMYPGSRKSDNSPVVVKHVSKTNVFTWGRFRDDEMVPLEIAMLDRVRGKPDVSQMLDYYRLPEGDWLIVMERYKKCVDLYDFISARGSLDEDTARYLFVQLLNLLRSCTESGMTYKDKKDKNIIVNEGTRKIQLVDFGSSSLLKSKPCQDLHFHGTLVYGPPEIIRREPYQTMSLGILLFYMVLFDPLLILYVLGKRTKSSGDKILFSLTVCRGTLRFKTPVSLGKLRFSFNNMGGDYGARIGDTSAPTLTFPRKNLTSRSYLNCF